MAAPLYSAYARLTQPLSLAGFGMRLPARGKTYLAHAIQRYLLWLGVKCKVFNLANVRRDELGPVENLPEEYFGSVPKTQETRDMKFKVMRRIKGMIERFFAEGGQVAVYDANNSNEKHRNEVREWFADGEVQTIFIESLCNDEEMVERNIRSIYQYSPDYIGWDLFDVIKSFKQRIAQHEVDYEPITEPSFPHVQLLNLGERIVMNNVQGYLQNRIVFFLMNIHNRDRKIYFARAGEALIEHSYKADAELSSLGVEYSERLHEFITSLRKRGLPNAEQDSMLSQKHSVSWISNKSKPVSPAPMTSRALQVWCSTRKRSVLTAAPFRESGCKVYEHMRLCEMNPGVVDGMSSEEILRRFPDSLETKERDPYRFRFPRAESYHDLAIRLEPVIFELERTQEDVLIVGQSSVLRCLIAYLQGNKPAEIPFIQVREGDLVEILPQAFGVSSHVYSFWDPSKKREERDIQFAARAAEALKERGENTDSSNIKEALDQIAKEAAHEAKLEHAGRKNAP